MKGCRSQDVPRDQDARVEMPAEARAGLALHLAPLAAAGRPHRPAGAVANRRIGSRAHHRSNRREHSACCFAHPALPT